MIKFISTLVLIFAILLFPPAVLALVSNNALPGDGTYSIKRKLEDGIVFLASFNPSTKAWFSVTRSNRRFDEVKSLIAQGKGAGETLNELVSQTSVAAAQVSQIDDLQKKEEIISQLSKSIEKYDTGLGQVSQQAETSLTSETASTQPSITLALPTEPTSTPTPTTSAFLPKAPLPTPTNVSVKPTTTRQPSPSPTPSVAPTTSPHPSPNRDREAIVKARKDLAEIKQKLDREEHKQKTEEKEN